MLYLTLPFLFILRSWCYTKPISLFTCTVSTVKWISVWKCLQGSCREYLKIDHKLIVIAGSAKWRTCCRHSRTGLYLVTCSPKGKSSILKTSKCSEHFFNCMFGWQVSFHSICENLTKVFYCPKKVSKKKRSREQRWCCGESACLPGLGSTPARCHMWVEFVVGSRLVLWVFLWVFQFSFLPKIQHLQIQIWPG